MPFCQHVLESIVSLSTTHTHLTIRFQYGTLFYFNNITPLQRQLNAGILDIILTNDANLNKMTIPILLLSIPCNENVPQSRGGAVG